MGDIAISSDGRDSVVAFRNKLAAGEANGAASIWIASHLFERDPISLAGHALAETTRINAALMALSPFVVHPVFAAMAAATLDELHPGRISMCLGVGSPADLRSVRMDARKPLRTMREALEIARALFIGEKVSFAGEAFSVVERRLGSGRRHVPLVLAASGPQMLELAGALADGVLISAGASLEFVRWALDIVHRAAKGRPVRAYALAYVSLDDDESRAHGRLRRMLATVLRGEHHSHNLELAGSVLDQARLGHAIASEDWATAEALIEDDIVRRHAVSGTAQQVCQRLADYYQAGVDEVIIAGVRDHEYLSKILVNAAGARPEER